VVILLLLDYKYEKFIKSEWLEYRMAITNLLEFKSERQDRTFHEIGAKLRKLEESRGYILEEGTEKIIPKYIAQGSFPFKDYPIPGVINLNYFDYTVDNDLVRQGWNPCGSLALDENLIRERVFYRKIGESKDVKEVKTMNRFTSQPVMVFYWRKRT